MKNQEGLEFGSESSNLLQSPKFLKYLLNKEITFVYALIMDQTFKSGDAFISFVQKDLTQNISLQIQAQQAIENPAITKLTVKSLIRELEKNVTENKDMIIYLSTKFGVLSTLTSFIAVQEVYDPVKKTMVRRNIPVAVTQDYGYENQYSNQYYGGGPKHYTKGQPRYVQPQYVQPAQDGKGNQDQAYDTSSSSQDQKNDKKDQKKSQKDYMNLIYLQRADGSFQLDQEFADNLGYKLTVIKAAIPSILKDNKQKEEIWATILALTQLEVKLPEFEPSWRLVAKKGQGWLNSIGLSSDELEKIRDFSKDFLIKNP